MEWSTRRVEIAGIASEPDGAWMTQVSRNVTDAVDGFLPGKRFLLHDRDPLFTLEFRETIATVGVQPVRLPPRAPNLNAFAARFVRTIKESCLEWMIFFGEGSLRRAMREFVEHYHRERNHQQKINSNEPSINRSLPDGLALLACKNHPDSVEGHDGKNE